MCCPSFLRLELFGNAAYHKNRIDAGIRLTDAGVGEMAETAFQGKSGVFSEVIVRAQPAVFDEVKLCSLFMGMQADIGHARPTFEIRLDF